MKTVFTPLVVWFISLLILVHNIYADESKTNVLSYYAITNQLDGQPMIDMNNVLRFYPVFSFRGKTDEVHITVYKNGTRYHVPAIANEDKSYWEIKLPPFELGEAIQRIEAEVKINAQNTYAAALSEYRMSILREMKNSDCNNCGDPGKCNELRCLSLKNLLCDIQKTVHLSEVVDFLEQKGVNPVEDQYTNSTCCATDFLMNINGLKTIVNYRDFFDTIEMKDVEIRNHQIIIDQYEKKIKGVQTLVLQQEQSEKNAVNPQNDSPISTENTNSNANPKKDTLRDSLEKLKEVRDSLSNALSNKRGDLTKLINLKESRKTTVEKIIDKLNSFDPCACLDITNRTSQGPPQGGASLETKEGVKNILKTQFGEAKRRQIANSSGNKDFDEAYKKYLIKSLSDTMSAGASIRPGDIVVNIENSEAHLLYRNYKRGVRYLTALDPAERLGIFRLRYIPFAIIGKELVKPLGDKPTGIFEVGMSFGDPIVSGDDFTVPPFAPERLGVAFAISNEFFSDSARVAAIAITYDFNSYGSLAVGTNFNTKESKIQSYLSFGINKKAFEGLVKAIRKLFE